MAKVAGLLCRFFDDGKNEFLRNQTCVHVCARVFVLVCVCACARARVCARACVCTRVYLKS